MKQLFLKCAAGAVTVGLLGMPVAFAEMDSEEVIKYRQNVMKSLGAHMGATASIVRGKVDYGEQLQIHAAALAEVSTTTLSLFPPDSDFGETRAKPEVWDKRAEFEQAAKDSERAAQAFLEVVQSGRGDQIGQSFGKLSDSCKACHKKFRAKKE